MKHLRSLLMIIAVSLLLAACGSGGEGGGDSSGGINASKLDGTWEVIKAFYDGKTIDAPDGIGIIMTFSGGEYTYETPGGCVEQGTYVADGSTITSTTTADTCEPEEVGEVSAVNYSVTATTFIISNGAEYILFEKR